MFLNIKIVKNVNWEVKNYKCVHVPSINFFSFFLPQNLIIYKR